MRCDRCGAQSEGTGLRRKYDGEIGGERKVNNSNTNKVKKQKEEGKKEKRVEERREGYREFDIR